MLLSVLTTFFQYDHPALYQVLSQFHFTWRDNDATGFQKLSTTFLFLPMLLTYPWRLEP